MSRSSFETNKVIAAVLVTLLLGHLAGLLSDALIHPVMPEKHAYAPVDVAAVSTSGGGESAAAEAAVLADCPAAKPGQRRTGAGHRQKMHRLSQLG
jgi:hypothetical protein